MGNRLRSLADPAHLTPSIGQCGIYTTLLPDCDNSWAQIGGLLINGTVAKSPRRDGRSTKLDWDHAPCGGMARSSVSARSATRQCGSPGCRGRGSSCAACCG